MIKCSNCGKKLTQEKYEKVKYSSVGGVCCASCIEKIKEQNRKEQELREQKEKAWLEKHPVYSGYWFRVGFWFAAGFFVFNLIIGVIVLLILGLIGSSI